MNNLPPGTLVVIALITTSFLIVVSGSLAGLMLLMKRKTERDIHKTIAEKLNSFGSANAYIKEEFIKLHQQVASLTRELAQLKQENAQLIHEVSTLTKEVNRLHYMVPPDELSKLSFKDSRFIQNLS